MLINGQLATPTARRLGLGFLQKKLHCKLLKTKKNFIANFLKQKKQLEQTQQLLEEYYQQSQSLKLQLMQRN